MVIGFDLVDELSDAMTSDRRALVLVRDGSMIGGMGRPRRSRDRLLRNWGDVELNSWKRRKEGWRCVEY